MHVDRDHRGRVGDLHGRNDRGRDGSGGRTVSKIVLSTHTDGVLLSGGETVENIGARFRTHDRGAI